MKVSLIQMNSGRDIDKNLDEAYRWIEKAASQDTRLVVLPEMFACLGVTNQYEVASTRFVGSDVLSTLSKWAKQFQTYLVVGSIPKLVEQLGSADKEKVHAASLLFTPDGELVAQYNKIHLFDVDVADEKGSYRESDTFFPGNRPVSALVDEHKLGMSVCYDLRFPELYQEYMKAGCSLITVPSAFTYQTGQKHWDILLRARAIETQSFVLAANQGGVHEDGRHTWGHSMIVGPDGNVIAKLDGQQSGVITAELDFQVRHGIQEAMPLMRHKRLNSED